MKSVNKGLSITRSVFIFLTAAALLISCSGSEKEGEAAGYRLVDVVRGDMIVTASATGSIEPVRVVEVKSKASGEIIRMPVESGDMVEKGAILVQLDREEVRSSLAQAEANLEEAEVRVRVSEARLARSETLSGAGLQSEEVHEDVILAHATARTELVKTTNVLAVARERFDDATVRAPIGGTVISKLVEEGQIISSATSQVSGGTVLLTMADLREVQIRALIDETDVGLIRPGQEVEVIVDAFPRKRFSGYVIKIEPMAVVEQNVTTFPVLVRIPNEESTLLPGMNAEVEIRIDHRENALIVPNEAVRTEKDALFVAMALGMARDEAVDALGENLSGRRRSTGVVFVPAGPVNGGADTGTTGGPGGFRPVRVDLGIRNWDDTEILSGLKEGDKVVVTLSSGLLRQQQRWENRAKQWGGMPGVKKSSDKK